MQLYLLIIKTSLRGCTWHVRIFIVQITSLQDINLTPIQKIAIAEKYRPTYVKLAEENKKIAMEKARMGNPNNQNEQFMPKSASTVEPINTRDALAKIAGIGHDTYNKGKKILDFEKNEENLSDDKKEIIKKVMEYTNIYLYIVNNLQHIGGE